MEKYQIIVKIEQIRKYLEQGDCIKAATLAAEIDLKKIKSMSDLSVIAEAYFQSMQYKKARSLFLQIYEKTRSRRILAQLVHLSIKLEDASEAEKYLLEYIKIAPNDFYRYIFRFSIDKLLKKPDDILIKDLEELKKAEYMESWSYELAKLYHKTGDEKRCVAECSDIILWFGSGIYVEKAKALRAYYTGESESEETDSNKQEEKTETSKSLGAEDVSKIVNLLKAVGEKKPEQKEKMEESAEPVMDIQENKSEEEPLKDLEEKSEGNQTDELTEKRTENLSENPSEGLSEKQNEDQNEDQEDDFAVSKASEHLKENQAESLEEQKVILEDADHEIEAEDSEVLEEYPEYKAMQEAGKAESDDNGSDHQESQVKEADDTESEDAEAEHAESEDEESEEEDWDSEDEDDEEFEDDEESDDDEEWDDEESEGKEESGDQLQPEDEESYRISAVSEEEARALADLFDQDEKEKKRKKKKKSIFSKLKDAIRSAIEEEENRNREAEEIELEAEKEAQSNNLEMKEEMESSNTVKESIEESSNVQNDKEELEADLNESSMTELYQAVQTELKQERFSEECAEQPDFSEKNLQEASLEETSSEMDSEESLAERLEEEVQEEETEECSKSEELYVSDKRECLILDEVPEELLMVDRENALYERLREKQIKAVDLTGDFSRVESVRRSIMQCLEKAFEQPSRNVNLMIAGGNQMGKKALAKLLARDFHALGINPSPKVALIHALRLNRMNLKDKMAQLAGCMLIIEEACELSEESILHLQEIIEDERCQFGVILAGQTEKMDRLFAAHDTLRTLFYNRIFIPEFTANDYLGYAYSYLNERDYQIREDALMTLGENIDKIMRAEGTLEAVTNYLKQVIRKAEGRNAKKIAALTESREYDTAELLVLKVEDFIV